MLSAIRHRWSGWFIRWSEISDSLDNYHDNAVLGGYLN